MGQVGADVDQFHGVSIFRIMSADVDSDRLLADRAPGV
jgi:hypothetical protein